MVARSQKSKAPRVHLPTHTLYISDPAHAELVQRARLAGYIQSDANIGLSRYLDVLLLKGHFTDARPMHVRAQDDGMLAAFMAPEWRLHSPRLPRHIGLSNDALVRATTYAVSLGMAFSPSKRMLGAPTYFDDVHCTAVLLEALGTGWVEVQLVEA
jgi:hypothetical protein